jgi:hypothetical protein
MRGNAERKRGVDGVIIALWALSLVWAGGFWLCTWPLITAEEWTARSLAGLYPMIVLALSVFIWRMVG